MNDPYVRRGRLLRVIDGDTILVTLDEGLYLSAAVHLRLLGVDTPELHDHDPALRAAALAAKLFVQGWFLEHWHDTLLEWPLYVRTERADSFARWLAEVECHLGHSLNADLLESGMAVVYRPARVQP